MKEENKRKEVKIYVDAGKNRKTGMWQIGFVLHSKMKGINSFSRSINLDVPFEKMNSNQAEKIGVKKALEYISKKLRTKPKSKIMIFTDNSLAAQTKMPNAELLISWISRENKFLKQADFLTH